MSDEMRHLFDLQLSERETFLIGEITAQWGALEHEVFIQTIKTFIADAPDDQEELPRAMDNLRFNDVLALWKTRVINEVKDERAPVLQQQFERILELKDYRNALAHGMWDWSTRKLGMISTVRVSKMKIITTHFTAEALQDFCEDVAEINFKIRFPAGLEDYAQHMAKQGSYISRRGLRVLTGAPVADEFF